MKRTAYCASILTAWVTFFAPAHADSQSTQPIKHSLPVNDHEDYPHPYEAVSHLRFRGRQQALRSAPTLNPRHVSIGISGVSIASRGRSPIVSSQPVPRGCRPLLGDIHPPVDSVKSS
jgi:hypothetical protein